MKGHVVIEIVTVEGNRKTLVFDGVKKVTVKYPADATAKLVKES